MKSNIEELRKKYMDNPPEGMTSKDIRNMSEDELLDMDFFLNEDDLFADEAGVEGFYIFICPLSMCVVRTYEYFPSKTLSASSFPMR